MDKTEAEVRKAFSKVYAKLTLEEKANYGDVVKKFGGSQREVSHGERDLQAESEDVKERELHNHCSFDRLHRIFNFLTPAQKKAVRRAGFGTFLRRDVPYVSTSLVKWLLENIDPSRCTLTLNGKKYTMSACNFEYVTGIKDGGESIEFQGAVDISDLKDAIIGEKLRISMTDLEEQLEGSQDADELFVVRFALVSIGTVLCPPSGIHLSNSHLYAMSDTRHLGRKNWASHAVRHLMESIRHYQDSQKCSRVMKWIRNVGGFPEVPLLKPRKEKDELCPTEDVKLIKPVPMKHLKKDVPSPSGYLSHNISHSSEKKDNDELMVLKNEVATLNSIVVGKKEDENVMSMDEGDDFVETSIENIRKSCEVTSKAKSAATSKDKRIGEEFDEEIAIGEELSPFEKDRHSSEGSPIKEETLVTKDSSSLEATLKDLTAFYKKKMVLVMLKYEVVEKKSEKSSGKKKLMLMDESTSYADFTKSNGFTVGPFKVRDEAARVEVFKVAFFVLSNTLDSG
ncbi:hypothetical protein TorRG33x02_004190 [Trema orientale]|uniref:Uncharacterized protein n=1 Tax=Trema orientale TaxID=63057 RepID=A0A2P5G262_TREOI|nr:hypothetical protein TorRG33x02_004190 [Trema orientale]